MHMQSNITYKGKRINKKSNHQMPQLKATSNSIGIRQKRTQECP